MTGGSRTVDPSGVILLLTMADNITKSFSLDGFAEFGWCSLLGEHVLFCDT